MNRNGAAGAIRDGKSTSAARHVGKRSGEDIVATGGSPVRSPAGGNKAD
jgi:hypothetical protein